MTRNANPILWYFENFMLCIVIGLFINIFENPKVVFFSRLEDRSVVF